MSSLMPSTEEEIDLVELERKCRLVEGHINCLLDS